MKYILKFALLFLILVLNSCSKNEKEISLIKEIDQEAEMISAYKEGFKELESGDAFSAAVKFLESELLFPQSDWAPKSLLMAAYSYYSQDYYTEAIFNLERFIKTYQDDERLDYAYYLLGMCYYEKIEGEKKDLQPLLTAKKNFDHVIDNYPNTDLALDSKLKNGLINDILASKEMYIARYYIKKKKWIPAINRFKNIINYYETTIYAEEALHRLVEIHYKIGLNDEAKKYAILLGYNYLSGEWYKKSYKLYNRDYGTKTVIKEKSGLLKKFKKIFE
jgi:outer membrane protein assembly factor BamD